MHGSRGRGAGDQNTPLKTQSYRLAWKYWSRSHGKSQSYQASIQCWAIADPSVKRHLNGVSLADRYWPSFSGILVSLSTHQLKRLAKLSGTPSDKTFWNASWSRNATITDHRPTMALRGFNSGQLSKPYVT